MAVLALPYDNSAFLPVTPGYRWPFYPIRRRGARGQPVHGSADQRAHAGTWVLSRIGYLPERNSCAYAVSQARKSKILPAGIPLRVVRLGGYGAVVPRREVPEATAAHGSRQQSAGSGLRRRTACPCCRETGLQCHSDRLRRGSAAKPGSGVFLGARRRDRRDVGAQIQ